MSSEDVERAMEWLFMAVESLEPSMKGFKDVDFDGISQLLLQLGKPGWSERPRIYAILRVIGSIGAMDLFVNAELLDIAIPYTQSQLLSVLPRDVALTFIEKQSMVMTETYGLENAGGRHQHLDHDADAHFFVVRDLGSGGFGGVDHVRSKLSLQDYARKRIRRSKIHSNDQIGINSFIRELTCLKKLKHHHIVTLIGSYTDPRYIGLIINEIGDCNLKEYLERTPFPKTEKHCLRGFYGSLISAVAYLHRSEVRHNGLKPQNILVKDHKLYIIDFGEAYDWSGSQSSTTMGNIGAFTPAYMAPEVDGRQPQDSSIDIYSLGLVFMDITTVLKGETLDTRIMHFKQNGTRTPFHRTNLAASESWVQLLQRKSSEDNQPLRWIREMIQERPKDRINAEVLLRKILTYKDDYRYYFICCEDYELSDEGMLYSRIESVHQVVRHNLDLNQGDLFPNFAQPNQGKNNLQNKKAASQSRNEEKQIINAAKNGNLLMIKLFLQIGADIETKDENGQTALNFAAQHGHLTLLKFLLSAGANIECQGNDGWKPLHTAAYNGRLQEVKELIERRAFIEAQTNDGKCALHLCCESDVGSENGRLACARYLLELGINVNATQNSNLTPLHLAAFYGQDSLVGLLLEYGADIYAEDIHTHTPLDCAIVMSHEEVARLLIERGADTLRKSGRAMRSAVKAGHEGIVRLLVRHEANTEGYEALLEVLDLNNDSGGVEYGTIEPSDLLTITRNLLTITRNDDAASSVGSVMSYNEEIFSQSGSVSSKSSAEPVYVSGIETVASLLIGDADLLPLYKEAMTKMDGERFVRNQRRLLKKYYINLRSEAQATLELEVIKILRSRHGRMSIAQKVLRYLTSPQDYERARSQKISREYVLQRHFLQATISTTNRREEIIERPATPPRELADENLLPTSSKDDLSNGSESSENSDRSDDDEVDKAVYPVEYAKRFLVGGSPFELYKQSVRYFIQPPPSSAVLDVSNRDINAVETHNSNVLDPSMDTPIIQMGDNAVQFEPPPLAIVKQLQEVIATIIMIILWILIISDASLVRFKHSLLNSKFSPTFRFMEACKFWFGTWPLPRGVVRIKWMCKCGHVSYDDMVEIRSGAVETLVQELRDTDGFRSIQTTGQALGYFSSSKINCWNLGVSAIKNLSRWRAGAKSTVLPETETGNALASTNPPIVPLWLLFCVNGSKLATLQHLDLCTTKSDRELFTRLREMYSILRSEVVFVRRIFLQLGIIHFVQFQLLPKAFVDGFVIGHLPPPERDDYRYKAVECKPPVPPKWMMHVFNHPEFGSEITLCLERFPKRVKERLHWESDEEVVGWGIYFAEHLHVAMVLTSIFIFMLSVSLLFGICWSILEHDVSSAFTVAAWLTSIGALGLSTWSAWKTLVW